MDRQYMDRQYMAGVFEDGSVKCTTLKGVVIDCDPLALWRMRQHCGNCPLLAFADKYAEEKFIDL